MKKPLLPVLLLSSCLVGTSLPALADPPPGKGNPNASSQGGGQGKGQNQSKGQGQDKNQGQDKSQGQDKNQGQDKGSSQNSTQGGDGTAGITAGLVTAGITLTAARELALGSGLTGYTALPPGIAKNLGRGKPLPPGIAKKTVPGAMLSRLPVHPGYEWQVVGSDLVLLAVGTAIVADVLAGVFR